ncbi:MAG: hypothetical protein R3A12_17885 [Ignavibacteria bacterium]
MLAITLIFTLLSFLNPDKGATPIPDLFNTGQNDQRLVLADGETDGHYLLTSSPVLLSRTECHDISLDRLANGQMGTE